MSNQNNDAAYDTEEEEYYSNCYGYGYEYSYELNDAGYDTENNELNDAGYDTEGVNC
jgi:hypothetical protein